MVKQHARKERMVSGKVPHEKQVGTSCPKKQAGKGGGVGWAGVRWGRVGHASVCREGKCQMAQGQALQGGGMCVGWGWVVGW